MTALKRKRSSGQLDSTQIASSGTPYLEGVPDILAELADVKLLVEGLDLPVHSYILRESPILLAALSAACSDTQRVCQVPLPGESRQHVLLVLNHMYKDDAAILSIPDGQVLATFAHKYNIKRLHKLSEAYLVANVSFTKTDVFDWAKLAECVELNLMLAHCERYIILNFHSMSAYEKKVSEIRQSALLRIMQGLAVRGVNTFGATRLESKLLEVSNICMCKDCHALIPGHLCLTCAIVSPFGQRRPDTFQATKLHQGAVPGLMAAVAPSVECLLRWQKTGDTKQ